MQDKAQYPLQGAGRRVRLTVTMALLGLMATVWGCGSGSKMAPVEGVVRLDGAPLSTGTIYFTPENGRSAAGIVQSDGTFQLSTFAEGDGAMVGMNRVSIIAFVGGSAGSSNDTSEERSLIPLYYNSPDSSKLTFEVKSGGTNHAEFDLSSK